MGELLVAGALPVTRRLWVSLARIALGGGMLLLLTGQSGRGVAQEPGTVDAANFVAVTDSLARPIYDACPGIVVADSATGRVVTRGSPMIIWPNWGYSAGQIAATSDGTLIATLSNENGWFIDVMTWSSDRDGWTENLFHGPFGLLGGGAIAISPDDTTMLAGEVNRVQKYRVADVVKPKPVPVGAITMDPAAESEVRGAARHRATVAAAIKYSADSQTAYVVGNDGFVYTLDVAAWAWRGDPIAYPAMSLPMHYRARRTFASLSPDERWLVINGGDPGTGSLLVLVDLRNGQATRMDALGLQEAWGVAFNYVGADRGLLAVHGRTAVATYRFDEGRLSPVAATRIPAPGHQSWQEDARWQARFASLAWSGDGARLIANQGGATEWRIFELSVTEPRQLTSVAVFESCQYNDLPPGYGPMGFDIVTSQKRPTLTATPTSSTTPTASKTPTITPAPTDTPSPSGTPTASSTATDVPPSATPTATAPPTLAPSPLHLPLNLREHCRVGTKRMDVALVIDASTSMRDGHTTAGRTKFAAAIEAARSFVDTLALPADQAAVVVFNSDAQVVVGLTGRRADVDAALARIPGLVRQHTRIDWGIEVAHEELFGPRHNPVNQAVMIVLTDGLANPEPASTAVRRAQEAKDDGITIFTVGLGKDDELNVVELREMASRSEYFYHAPDGEDLLAIYDEIATEIPCPADSFWGGR